MSSKNSTTMWLFGGATVFVAVTALGLLTISSSNDASKKRLTATMDRAGSKSSEARNVKLRTQMGSADRTRLAMNDDSKESRLIEVDAYDITGSDDWLAAQYDNAFFYTGSVNEVVANTPPSDPSSPDSAAGTVESEAVMVAKEEKLLQHFPELREKVEKSRAEREKSAQLFEQRGMGPEEWALKNGVHLDK